MAYAAGRYRALNVEEKAAVVNAAAALQLIARMSESADGNGGGLGKAALQASVRKAGDARRLDEVRAIVATMGSGDAAAIMAGNLGGAGVGVAEALRLARVDSIAKTKSRNAEEQAQVQELRTFAAGRGQDAIDTIMGAGLAAMSLEVVPLPCSETYSFVFDPPVAEEALSARKASVGKMMTAFFQGKHTVVKHDDCPPLKEPREKSAHAGRQESAWVALHVR